MFIVNSIWLRSYTSDLRLCEARDLKDLNDLRGDWGWSKKFRLFFGFIEIDLLDFEPSFEPCLC